ncbi:nucleosome-destabilizing factor [Brevipalpus obovatus]|uniref:nucleosome-destabilizing factor n=1 Tax=Brevipalpus obovatus TaxID=246614 RepID=UPI003D9EBC6B
MKTETIGSKFNIGDLVWAKMKGFSPWPGKVVPPHENMKRPPGNYKNKPIQCVYFFGSNNYAWIQEDAIKPYPDMKEAYSKLNKSNAFKEALDKIEEYIKSGGTDPIPPQRIGLSDSFKEKSPEKVHHREDKNEKNDERKDDKDRKDKGDSEERNKIDGKDTEDRDSKKEKNSSSAQKDYSRTPFKSKPKKPSTSFNDEIVSTPTPAKRSRTSTSAVEDSSSSVTTKSSVSSPSTTSASSPTKGARNILARTSNYLLDNTNSVNNQTDLDIGSVSAKSKTITPSTLKFGFIGLGLMGQRLLKNLLNSGHSVTIWNRTPSKCKDFTKAGATKATTPADVIAAADVTFSCLADPHAVREIVFGNCGVLAEMKAGKGFVEMTSIGPDTSNDICEAIISRGGRYLEAPIIGGGKQQAEEGNLTILVAGDKSLFEDCNSCFQAISKHSFYLGGQVGDASKMGLVVSMLMGNLIGSLAESMALADRTGLSQKDLLEILSLSPLNCHTLVSKGKGMIEGGFATQMPLTHMQKDLRLALELAEVFEHPIPITASTNEVFKHAKHLGYSDHDVAAVYIRSRF